MSALEDIKARASERRGVQQGWGSHAPVLNPEAEDDLDRAIAIAQENDTLARENRKLVIEAWKERDQAISKLSLANAAASVEQAIKWRDERDQARAAVEQLHNDVGTLTEELNQARYTLRWYRESLMLRIHPVVEEGQALLGRTFREESSYRNDNTDQ